MYVDPNRNKQAGNLKWILPYCKPDLPRVGGAFALFCLNNAMALIIPLLSGLIVDRVITQGHVSELTRLCVAMVNRLELAGVGCRSRLIRTSLKRLVELTDEFCC